MHEIEALSQRIRNKIIDIPSKRIRIANLVDTPQEKDLKKRPTCDGFGRVHHFERATDDRWPPNPLPMDPACKALGLPPTNLMTAHVFQCAGCDSHCWYCFVPPELLNGNPDRSAWFTASEMLDLYLAQPDPPKMIDLSGGEPGLVPEWVLWMMHELEDRQLDSSVYLWSDDNLTCNYFWTVLTDKQREFLCSYRKYGKVACLKGFSSESFAFNTSLDSSLFQRRIHNLRQYVALDLDLYVYVTLTAPSIGRVKDEMSWFVDLLQDLNPNLPLRTVPLLIRNYTPTKARLTTERLLAFENQYAAAECWIDELSRRYSPEVRAMNIADVPLGVRGRS